MSLKVCRRRRNGDTEPCRERGGKDTFVHISAVERAGLNNLAEGERSGKTSSDNLKTVG
jgi:CspA family cold shock protein